MRLIVQKFFVFIIVVVSIFCSACTANTLRSNMMMPSLHQAGDVSLTLNSSSMGYNSSIAYSPINNYAMMFNLEGLKRDRNRIQGFDSEYVKNYCNINSGEFGLGYYTYSLDKKEQLTYLISYTNGKVNTKIEEIDTHPVGKLDYSTNFHRVSFHLYMSTLFEVKIKGFSSFNTEVFLGSKVNIDDYYHTQLLTSDDLYSAKFLKSPQVSLDNGISYKVGSKNFKVVFHYDFGFKLTHSDLVSNFHNFSLGLELLFNPLNKTGKNE